jgi:restriction system protein
MPRSRDRHPLVELTRLPWWVSLVFAALVFLALRWLAPALAGSRPMLAPLGQAAAAHAHWVAAIFLLPIPFALFNAARRRRLVEARPSIDRLLTMPWQEFEQLVGEAYRRQGYRVTDRGGAGADGGIDLELRAQDKTLVVQCKRWKTRTVGVELVRDLYGAMVGEEAHGAIFVTSGSYTPDAIDFARDKPIKLVDGRGLVELLKGVRDRAPSSAREASARTGAPLVVTTAEGPITCPKCGSAMVRRVAKQGASAGGVFWGCSQFPSCRGTRAVSQQ